VDKSLLHTQEHARFHRHPLIHQYTREKLEERTDELSDARDAHAAWFVELAEEAGTHSAGPAQGEWLERMEREKHELRAALQWTLAGSTTDARATMGLRLAAALYRFWYYRSHWTEGRKWLRLAIDKSEDLEASTLPLRSKALHGAGVLAVEQGDDTAARELFQARLSLARESGDEFGQAAALNSLGVLALGTHDYARARELLEQSYELRLRLGRKDLLDGPRLNLGLVALAQEDYVRAQQEFEHSLAASREVGNDMASAIALINLGALHIDQRNQAAAEQAFEEAVELYRSLGNTDGLAHCLDGFAAAATLRGLFESGARLAGAAASLHESVGAASSSGDKAKRDRRLAPARAALGTQRFEAAWQSGYEAGYEQVLREVMEAETAPSTRAGQAGGLRNLEGPADDA
jgi:tetratricopeptide (TPR) repeat protein